MCQAGPKQDRLSSPLHSPASTPQRLTRFSTSSSSFIPSSSSSVRDRRGLSVSKSRYSHLTGSPRSKTRSWWRRGSLRALHSHHAPSCSMGGREQPRPGGEGTRLGLRGAECGSRPPLSVHTCPPHPRRETEAPGGLGLPYCVGLCERLGNSLAWDGLDVEVSLHCRGRAAPGQCLEQTQAREIVQAGKWQVHLSHPVPAGRELDTHAEEGSANFSSLVWVLHLFSVQPT